LLIFVIPAHLSAWRESLGTIVTILTLEAKFSAFISPTQFAISIYIPPLSPKPGLSHIQIFYFNNILSGIIARLM
jgi:hypothetical protein